MEMPKYPPKPKVGAPPIELTDKIHNTIVKYLKMGNYFETACAAAGIHKDLAYKWLRRGAKEPESVYEKFSDAVYKAQAEAETRDVDIIDQCANNPEEPDWRASAWRLERKFPRRWGRLERIEHSGPEGKPIEGKLSDLSDDELEEKFNNLLAKCSPEKKS